MRSDTYVVYSYRTGADGALNLIERKMFQTMAQAKSFFDQKKEEIIRDRASIATSIELNREIYNGDEWFMSDSENVEKYTRQFDFAAS